jgi:hypothetical protein
MVAAWLEDATEIVKTGATTAAAQAIRFNMALPSRLFPRRLGYRALLRMARNASRVPSPLTRVPSTLLPEKPQRQI